MNTHDGPTALTNFTKSVTVSNSIVSHIAMDVYTKKVFYLLGLLVG